MQPIERDFVQKQQAQLVRFLCDGGEEPPGFDSQDLAAAKLALIDKRCRSCLQNCPALDALGDRYKPLFQQYALSNPVPSGDPLEDARQFLSALLADHFVLDGPLLKWLVTSEASNPDAWLQLKARHAGGLAAFCLRLGRFQFSFLWSLPRPH
jgi:hypothetical protein